MPPVRSWRSQAPSEARSGAMHRIDSIAASLCCSVHVETSIRQTSSVAESCVTFTQLICGRNPI